MPSLKLDDCTHHGLGSGAELYVVEGDSAAGAVSRMRNAEYQAVLPMQGKPLGGGPDSDLAPSLTLAPRYVPPREIRLSVPGYRGNRAAVSGGVRPGAGPTTLAPTLASALGSSQPNVETIADLLRAMAQRRLPAGYQVGPGTGLKARCAPGLKVLKTQLTQGPEADVLRLGLRNTGAGTLPVNESQ